jgi:hypothetical protein
MVRLLSMRRRPIRLVGEVKFTRQISCNQQGQSVYMWSPMKYVIRRALAAEPTPSGDFPETSQSTASLLPLLNFVSEIACAQVLAAI